MKMLHLSGVLRQGFVMFLFWSMVAGSVIAQETFSLWPNGVPIDNGLEGPESEGGCVGNISEPTLTVYHPDPEVATDVAMLIVPGGGYSVVCMGHEGEAIAEWLTGIGITVGVLKYRLPNHHYEVPFQDAQQALRLMKSHADAWQVSPNKIGIMGFSAGGHLASTIGTHFMDDFSRGRGDHLELGNRPDFMALVYPVISMMDGVTHQGSQRGLLGENPDASRLFYFSNHQQVNAQTPPTFLVHASDDEVVIPANSTAFYKGLKENGVPAELHIFERGGHGFAVREDSPAHAWVALFEQWLEHTVGE